MIPFPISFLIIAIFASTAIIWLKVGSTAVASEGIRLEVAGNGEASGWEMSAARGNLDQRAVNILAASATANVVTVQEMNG